MKNLTVLVLIGLMLVLSAKSQAGLFSLTTNYSTGNSPTAVCLANLRGKQTFRDLAVVSSADDTVSVRLCLDDGTFGQATAYVVGDAPVSVRYGDLNSDRQDDLVTANAGTNTISVLMNLGVGANFRAATNYVVGSTATPAPADVAVGDVNGDGRPDVVVANFAEDKVSVLTNLGSGSLGGLVNYSVGSGPVSIALADMNGDGFVDIVTANKTAGTVTLLPGNSNGTFGSAQTVNYTSGGNPEPVCIWCRDLEGDGVMDLVLANYNEQTVTVLIGSSPGGVWTIAHQDDYSAGNNPASLTVRDLNHDGVMDIGVVNAASDNFQVWLGDGTGLFVDDDTYAVGDEPVAVAASNFNGDEAADVVVVNALDENVSVLLFSAPLAYPVAVSLNEDAAKSFSLRGVMLGGSNVVFVTNSLPAHGSLAVSSSNVVYTPATNYFGADTFDYVTVNLASSLTSAVAHVALTVLSVNDRPSFTLATNYIVVWEDSSLTNIPLFVIATNVGPANESSERVDFLLTPATRAAFAGTPSISQAGTLVFRPALNTTGAKTISIIVRDTGGTQRGGSNASFPQTLTIDIIPNPVKPLKGSYSGLYYDTNGFSADSAGFFTFALNSRNGFSGRVTSATGRDAFTGQFDVTGHAHAEVVRRSGSTLEVDLQLDLTGGSDRVTGQVVDGSSTADLLGDRLVFNTLTNPAPQAGKHTMLILGDTLTPAVPFGDSYAVLNVTSNGIISMTGRLADNTGISQSVGLSKNGQWPFYCPLYGFRGVVMGWVQFTNTPATELEATVNWSKTAFTSTFYPDGFDMTTSVIGSAYVAPTSGQRVVAVTNGILALTGGELLAGSTNVVGYFYTNNTAAFTNGASLKLAVPSSGIMDGNFNHPDLRANKRFNGVVLQQQHEIRGYFPGTSEVGSFRVYNY